VDTAANLTVDAGRFCGVATLPYGALGVNDTVKARAFIEFFKQLHYDAVALGSSEMAYGLDFWKAEARGGLPVLAANLLYKGNVLTYPKPDRPVFQTAQPQHRSDNGQYVIREQNGVRLGVIGFLSQSAWKAAKDSTSPVSFHSPFEMHSLVRDVAGQCDHLTVVGDFTLQEADSLTRVMPEINLVVASNIRIDQSQRRSHAVIVGLPPRGNTGNYVEWNLAMRDSADATSRTVSLETGAPEDTSIARLLVQVKEKTTGPAPVPAKPAMAPAPTPPLTPPSKPATATQTSSAIPAKPVTPAPSVPPDQDGTKQ
jgi:hypothetical protein